MSSIWQGGTPVPAGYMGAASANALVFVDANGVQKADPAKLGYDETTKGLTFGQVSTLTFSTGGTSLENFKVQPTSNSAPLFPAIPAAGLSTAGFVAYNNVNPTLACVGASLQISNTNVRLDSLARNGGTPLPLILGVEGEKFRIDTSGNTTLGGILGAQSLKVNNVPSATRWIEISGTVGGNPIISTSAGGLTLNPVGKNVYLTGASTDYSVFNAINTGGVEGQFAANGNAEVDIRAVTNHPMVFWTNNTERARFRATGGMDIISDTTNALGIFLRARAADDLGVLGFYNTAGSTEWARIQGGSSSVMQFATGASPTVQFQVANTASSTRYLNVTGSNGGNPKIYPSAGNIVLGAGSALATTATDGYAMIPSCAGAPTGVPSNNGAGQIALHYDTTNNRLYAYNGAWRSTLLA